MAVFTKLQDMNGYHLNPDIQRVKSVLNAVARANGNCPCVPQNTWSKDTICPCRYYRTGQGCHCGLYVLEA